MIDVDDASHTATAGEDFILFNHCQWVKWIIDRVRAGDAFDSAAATVAFAALIIDLMSSAQQTIKQTFIIMQVKLLLIGHYPRHNSSYLDLTILPPLKRKTLLTPKVLLKPKTITTQSLYSSKSSKSLSDKSESI
jgi:hypothetical protein